MAYELGASVKFAPHITGEVAVLNTKNAYTGWRAFARNEKTGEYVEVFESCQESQYVQGVNQGFWFRSTHETRDAAWDYASKAYRWINKKKGK